MLWRRYMTGAIVLGALMYSAHLAQHTVSLHAANTASGEVGNLPGEMAPNFTVRTASGKYVSLSHWRGHGVWLNFWATWCPYCREEMTTLNAEQKRWAGRLTIIGVDTEEPSQTVSQFARANHLGYIIGLDEEGGVSAQYGVDKLPTSFFIGPNGHIRAVYSGAITSPAMAAPFVQQITHKI